MSKSRSAIESALRAGWWAWFFATLSFPLLPLSTVAFFVVATLTAVFASRVVWIALPLAIVSSLDRRLVALNTVLFFGVAPVALECCLCWIFVPCG